ncbi:UNVERIFIED_CONTAM: hypothetical protein HDU68_001595 [Siphonaria sp. JEL0065]|nr:hypothetical protein HDU68_001595 [Siphonaria sp. JEL0065]
MLGFPTQLKQKVSKAALKKTVSRASAVDVSVVSPSDESLLGQRMDAGIDATTASMHHLRQLNQVLHIVLLGKALAQTSVRPAATAPAVSTFQNAFFLSSSTSALKQEPSIKPQASSAATLEADVKEFLRLTNSFLESLEPSTTLTTNTVKQLHRDVQTTVGSIVIGFENGMKAWPRVWLRSEEFLSVVQRLELMRDRL